MPDSPDATVRELVDEARRFADQQGQHIISFDLEPEEIGDHVLLIVAVGKTARNTMARLLNTFLDFQGEENGP